NQTKQPITDKLSAIGCLKGVLTPVSKTGGSPLRRVLFMKQPFIRFRKRRSQAFFRSPELFFCHPVIPPP
ncbi:hypothetical protein ACQKET_14095, partial [Bacillus velezensis]